MCKLAENIKAPVVGHADRHNILSEYQHGFRRKRSCETQLLLTTHDLASAYKKRKQIDMIVLDFTKAFDKVPHRRLLKKLEHYGVRGSTLAWIRDFLSGRSQTVLLEGETSSGAPVISGVPQGTVMGPILFLLYINDLPEGLSSNVRLFADDCVLYREISTRNDSSMLQNDLDLLNKWEKAWQMEFNPSKCAVLSFTASKSHPEYNYYIHNEMLARAKEHKYLGVMLSSDFKWSSHINSAANKARQTLGFVKRNTKSMSRSVRDAAYRSLVRPHLEYASVVWDPHTGRDIDRLEGVQRHAARYVIGDYRRGSSVTNMLNDLKWEPLARRRMVARQTMVFRILRGEVAIPRDLFFQYNEYQQTRRSTSFKLTRSQPRGNIDKFAFAQRAVPEWNSLPAHVVDAPSVDAFRLRLLNFLKM